MSPRSGKYAPRRAAPSLPGETVMPEGVVTEGLVSRRGRPSIGPELGPLPSVSQPRRMVSQPPPPSEPSGELRKDPMSRARGAFESVGKVSSRMAAPVRPVLDRFFDALLPALPSSDDLNWGDEADWARLQQEPLRARRLLRWVVLVVVLLLIWAGFAKIDEVTRGEGKVIPSSQMQTVTAIDAGPIEKILVKVGDVVDDGQELIRLDPTRLQSDLTSSRAEYFALKAKAARLKALVNAQEFVMPADVIENKPDIAAHEKALYDSSTAEIEAQLAISRQQLAGKEEELKGAQARLDSSTKAYDTAARIYKMKKPLLAKGAVSEVELLEAKQAEFKALGERDQAAADLQKAISAIEEATSKLSETELNTRNKWSNELSDTTAKLQSIEGKLVGGEDKVERARVRSPMKGTVNFLYNVTVGSFVQAGAKLVDVVPLGDKLLVEAKVKPKDIAFIAIGMPARVKITAYDFSIYGGIDGEVEHISPDTITDDKGNAFYLIRVRTEKSTLGADKPINPGMVAEVDVLTGKKSVLNYLLKPVLRAKANAMTER
ncbi:MAG: HlyD family type I secretion periplasmic adaptor subunit [Azoarcus sp.]|jgi:adhesin transport system membrane fusion protein|nr:HlyD family type I secretion periplasmic adaptor subunit [Azoarcus sp.]